MKLVSILKVMDGDDAIEVVDENAPIDEMVLFRGSVKDCMEQGYFRNGVVGSLCACGDILIVGVNIEYKKRKRGVWGDA